MTTHHDVVQYRTYREINFRRYYYVRATDNESLLLYTYVMTCGKRDIF